MGSIEANIAALVESGRADIARGRYVEGLDAAFVLMDEVWYAGKTGAQCGDKASMPPETPSLQECRTTRRAR